MADRVVPLSVAERHKRLFTEDTPKEELTAWGLSHEKEGMYHDALEYFARAASKGDLERLLSLAVEEADLVLFINTVKALGEEHRLDDLRRLRDKAEKLGKQSVAAQAASLLVIKEK
ncbi:MAG TPA: hypothetical protein PK747_06775 [Acidobacteriota bacterium]|nr:hypothetical protein [Acidobacteriota bacterium]